MLQSPGILEAAKKRSTTKRLRAMETKLTMFAAFAPNLFTMMSITAKATQEKMNPESSASQDGSPLMLLFARRFIAMSDATKNASSHDGMECKRVNISLTLALIDAIINPLVLIF